MHRVSRSNNQPAGRTKKKKKNLQSIFKPDAVFAVKQEVLLGAVGWYAWMNE